MIEKTNIKKTFTFCLILVTLLVALDQVTKLWVFFNLKLGEEFQVLGKWLRIHHVQNPGMAFGIRLPNKYFKLFLTIGRLFAAYMLLNILYINSKNKKVSILNLLGFSFILAGAIGNILDSTFYGIFLDNAPKTSPMKLFYGQVVDMILVGVENIRIPSFIPFLGGQYLPPFPVFNVADCCVSIGASSIILQYLLEKYLLKSKKSKSPNTAENRILKIVSLKE